MIQAICWMLIHSLWQGLLFAVITGIVLVYTKKSPSVVRYNLLSGLFFLFLAVCVVTFFREWSVGQKDAGLNDLAPFSENNLSSFIGRLNEYLSEQAPLIVLVWSLVFLFKCVRMIADIVYTQRVRNQGVEEPPVYWKDKMLAFAAQLQIKRTVRLLESKLVKFPFVTGHWKPVIFVPLGLLTKLPEGEIEAVLLHELAHIRRNDYFMNFLQHIGENIFFFNPGLLWISSLLREERENCCDDMAIDRTKNKIAFVRALISFREYDLGGAVAVVPFPAGKHQLLQRVTRIVHNKNKSLNKAERWGLFASSCIISLLLGATANQVIRPPGGGDMIIVEERNNVPSDKGIQPMDPARPDNTGRHGNLPESEVSSASGGTLVSEAPSSSDEQIYREKAVAEKDMHLQDDNRIKDDNTVKADEEMAVEPPEEINETEIRVLLTRVLSTRESSAQVLSPREAVFQEDKSREQARHDKLQAEKDALQAAREREQADRDREQAEIDRKQALDDRLQADHDRLQSERDREQAIKDREQAGRDREQAEKDRKQADREREQERKTTHS